MARRLLFYILLTVIAVAIVQLTAGIRGKIAEARFPAKGEIVELDGVKIHAQVAGEGPDLILIHGASGNLRDFTFTLMDQLKDRYRVIAFDRPGLGWSRRPEGYGGIWNSAGESPRLQAQILGQAAKELGVENPIVVGHSFGGAVAMAWALEHSDTGALVLLGGVSHPWTTRFHWQYPLNASVAGGALVVPLFSAFAPTSYLNSVVGAIFEPQAVPDGYFDHVGAPLSLRRNAIRANARQVNGLLPHVTEIAEHYPDLTLPIEAVHGDLDTIVPMTVHSVPLSERVDSANLTVLNGVGHMPHHADQGAVIAAIDRAAERAGLR
ncbi:MAG: alpha/beta fold hydrolase [Arenibacterium sp.]